MSSSRLVYLELLRACSKTFKGDIDMLRASRQEIKSHFRKNAGLTDTKEIERALADGKEAADFVRNFIVQGVVNERGNIEVRPETRAKDIHIRSPHDIEPPGSGCSDRSLDLASTPSPIGNRTPSSAPMTPTAQAMTKAPAAARTAPGACKSAKPRARVVPRATADFGAQQNGSASSTGGHSRRQLPRIVPSGEGANAPACASRMQFGDDETYLPPGETAVNMSTDVQPLSSPPPPPTPSPPPVAETPRPKPLPRVARSPTPVGATTPRPGSVSPRPRSSAAIREAPRAVTTTRRVGPPNPSPENAGVSRVQLRPSARPQGDANAAPASGGGSSVEEKLKSELQGQTVASLLEQKQQQIDSMLNPPPGRLPPTARELGPLREEINILEKWLSESSVFVTPAAQGGAPETRRAGPPQAAAPPAPVRHQPQPVQAKPPRVALRGEDGAEEEETFVAAEEETFIAEEETFVAGEGAREAAEELHWVGESAAQEQEAQYATELAGAAQAYEEIPVWLPPSDEELAMDKVQKALDEIRNKSLAEAQEMPSGTQLTAEQQAELEDLEVENALLRGLAEDVLLAKVRLQQRKARAIHTSVVNYTGGHVPPGTDTTWA